MAEDQFKAGLAAERDVVLAREELRKAQSNLGKTNKQLGIYGVSKDGHYTITAPISGFITDKNVTENMQYTTASAGNFFTIADLDQVWVLANVFEADIANVKLGYKADITTLSYPDKHFHGVVDKVFNVLDPDSKALKVRIQASPTPATCSSPRCMPRCAFLTPRNRRSYRCPPTRLSSIRTSILCSCTRAATEVDTRPVTGDQNRGRHQLREWQPQGRRRHCDQKPAARVRRAERLTSRSPPVIAIYPAQQSPRVTPASIVLLRLLRNVKVPIKQILNVNSYPIVK